MAITRRIDNALYSRKALASAREAYAQYCVIRVVPQSDGLVEVKVEVKPDYVQESRQVMLEFWNYFLDAACQQRLDSV